MWSVYWGLQWSQVTKRTVQLGFTIYCSRYVNVLFLIFEFYMDFLPCKSFILEKKLVSAKTAKWFISLKYINASVFENKWQNCNIINCMYFKCNCFKWSSVDQLVTFKTSVPEFTQISTNSRPVYIFVKIIFVL